MKTRFHSLPHAAPHLSRSADWATFRALSADITCEGRRTVLLDDFDFGGTIFSPAFGCRCNACLIRNSPDSRSTASQESPRTSPCLKPKSAKSQRTSLGEFFTASNSTETCALVQYEGSFSSTLGWKTIWAFDDNPRTIAVWREGAIPITAVPGWDDT